MYTKGPWKYAKTHQCSHDAWYVITDAKGYGPIFEAGGKDFNGQIAEAKYLITDQTEIEANARLIASAPELLEACKQALSDLSNVMATSNGIYVETDYLEKAINKAEGRD